MKDICRACLGTGQVWTAYHDYYDETVHIQEERRDCRRCSSTGLVYVSEDDFEPIVTQKVNEPKLSEQEREAILVKSIEAVERMQNTMNILSKEAKELAGDNWVQYLREHGFI